MSIIKEKEYLADIIKPMFLEEAKWVYNWDQFKIVKSIKMI